MSKWLLLAALACGDRTELSDGEGAKSAGLDGAAASDGQIPRDAITPGEASTLPDAGAGPDGAVLTCTKPTVAFGQASDGCKVDVSWTCGTTMYYVGGGCTPFKGFKYIGYSGVCRTNGQSTGNFTDTDPTSCSCTDIAKAIAAAAKECGYPVGGGSTQ